ncbi:lipase 3-like isoform X1 [Daphnia pulex]|uniref:lipase 3-like isoform X1 n=1 Tax=Daphnia pulex TaxID=6669 RepID=UPI001EDF37C2|nr:lipase 3-like isoform X1 [Daphnia pulex]
MLFSIVLPPVMQVCRNSHDGFRWMLRLSSFLGIFWWCSCLLLLASASLDATSTNSSSSGGGGSGGNDSSSTSRMFGGFLFRRRTNQVGDSSHNNLNVEEQVLPLDWTLDDAEDKTFHSDDVRLPLDPEAYMSSPEIIRNRGYPLEIHHVTTDDGYILELHRIPPRHNGLSPLNGPTTGKIHDDYEATEGRGRPVFLQHGVFSSSACWLLNPSHRSLAFRLADLGYDVWMGNTRGNIYSRNHVELDPDQDPEFWQYSWDEIGYYDIPACINYVLAVTGWDKLVYAGHSLGTGLFFIAMIQHPELNSKVHRMLALAPISSKHNLRSPFRLVSPIIARLAVVMDKMPKKAIFDQDMSLRTFQKRLCERNFFKASFCRDILFLIAGANPDNFDLNLLPSVNAHLFQGTSIRVIAQFAQHYNTGKEIFQHYDFGKKGNLELYGTPEPAVYDLSKVTAPVYLYYGLNDLISTREDSEWAASQLGNVKGLFQIDDDLFNHWDFLWSINVNELLYNHILPLFR